jgi:hypothetical protein
LYVSTSPNDAATIEMSTIVYALVYNDLTAVVKEVGSHAASFEVLYLL